jgi:glycosyltransferase involved in cell wall biosynthesis
MFDNNSLISIITPCYNSAKYISQTIESVLAQTFQNWEMLIIDDCSIDGSDEIINQYCNNDTRIKYYRTESPSGSPTIPRNIGIKNAQGRYIAFLDSDDMWLPTKLENQIQQFDNDNIVIVFSYYEKINESGIRKNRIVTSPSSVAYKDLLKGNCIGFLTAMYDTVKVGKIYFNSIGHEDYVYWLSILRSGYIACNTNTVEALYCVRDNSISKNKLKASKWTWYIYRKFLHFNFFKSFYYYCFYFLRALRKYFN